MVALLRGGMVRVRDEKRGRRTPGRGKSCTQLIRGTPSAGRGRLLHGAGGSAVHSESLKVPTGRCARETGVVETTTLPRAAKEDKCASYSVLKDAGADARGQAGARSQSGSKVRARGGRGPRNAGNAANARCGSQCTRR